MFMEAIGFSRFAQICINLRKFAPHDSMQNKPQYTHDTRVFFNLCLTKRLISLRSTHVHSKHTYFRGAGVKVSAMSLPSTLNHSLARMLHLGAAMLHLGNAENR
jgi:hypothetical protein